MYACRRAAASYRSGIDFQKSISFLQMYPAQVAQVLGEPTYRATLEGRGARICSLVVKTPAWHLRG